MSTPCVSVIIPTYNRSDLVCRAIESVLDQTYGNVELIVVDDGSTDDTQSKLAQYRDRIQVLAQPNSGPSVARNNGVTVARGELVAFLDSDDYWMPQKLRLQVDALQRAGESVAVCLCNCEYSDGSGTTFDVAAIRPDCQVGLWLNPAEVLSTRPVIFTQAVIVRRHVLQRLGAFSAELPYYCEDHDLSLRLALEGPWALINEPLVVCRRAGSDSLGELALRDIVRLRSDQVVVRKRFVELVYENPRYRGLLRTARREHRRAARELVAARLSDMKSPVAGAAAWVLRFAARLTRAAYRRTPFHPRAVVQPLGTDSR